MLRFAEVGLALVLFLWAGSNVGSQPPREDKDQKGEDETAVLMKQKLKHSQKVLEGLALGNFDEIAEHSRELIEVSKKAQWRVIKTPEYVMWSNEFRRHAEDLIEKAKQKNIDGVTLSYLNLTMTCVRCHKYVREVRRVRHEDAGLDALASSR
ncbi:MAG: hypothetical protein KatS3mg105_4881 [Gemmatales bacterium]|nr:MAG: hypothetical protein KatS3mg105_4881 [Gemmatales bacterium]